MTRPRTALWAGRLASRQASSIFSSTAARTACRTCRTQQQGLSISLRGFHSTGLAAERIQQRPDASAKPTSTQPPTDIAFAFDIDGVLYRGGTPIPGAAATLRTLKANNIPYIFLTNGGGSPEKKKAASLQNRLGLQEYENVVPEDRMVQSHTPMKGWDKQKMENDTVFVTGSNPDAVREIARGYGFKRIVTPGDLIAARPDIYPFKHLKVDMHPYSEPLPDGKEIYTPADPYDISNIPSNALKIDHVFVWNDPRDWSLDTQIIHDILTSHRGYLGTISSKNGDKNLENQGWQADGQPELSISNLDLVWKTEYPVNRFGTGAWVEAFKGVWNASTNGMPLRYHALGKPLEITYSYAHRVLQQLNGQKPLRRVYMIGDNPESDIRGANDFNPKDGTEWESILVRTGVYVPTALEQEPKYKPTVLVDDVVEAVSWAMQREGADVKRADIMGREEEPLMKVKEMHAEPFGPLGRIVA